MKKIILIGGGGHCKASIDVIETDGEFQIAGIIGKPELIGSKVLNYPIIGDDSKLEIFVKKYKFALITIGHLYSLSNRISLYNKAIKIGFELPTIISPRAYVSSHSKLGRGNIVMHNSVINANTIIKDNCIINSSSVIEHDCLISDHCHISTNATINGNVKIGSKCFIGSGVIIKESINLQENSFIKAGTLIK